MINSKPDKVLILSPLPQPRLPPFPIPALPNLIQKLEFAFEQEKLLGSFYKRVLKKFNRRQRVG
jgi:hypothetical protein